MGMAARDKSVACSANRERGGLSGLACGLPVLTRGLAGPALEGP
jgi:hypothetical protein